MIEIIEFKLNNKQTRLEVDRNRTLLWVSEVGPGPNRAEIRLRNRCLWSLHGSFE